MQPSALPDLAHTHARPAHWLTTATAMAGVIALAGLLQPRPATASLPESRTTAAPAPDAPAPDAATAAYPLDCAGSPTAVTGTATGDLDGDGRPETVAAVRCQAGSGTPPHGLYVLTHSRDSATARVVATLVDPGQGLNVSELAVHDRAVTAALLGYSTPDVPRCCPDTQEPATWQWTGGAFLRTDGTAR
ncbi:hypothetical protein I3F58_07730 [Streptomyces sp. MUM 203J]|uniref:hypothetical protein n=1 Tax=Streptomyces sp. MUM 203J TaxID=2791990 RepID=UPI001F047822|nr:hypothetical protein [Streptomyces sp. MUM 203J]MCH0539455.1 hypothetical protein [Streptomyces sp. MUM 203J]